MKPFVLVAPLLLSSALAGGAGPRPVAGELTRRAALEAVTGVTVTQAPPFDGAAVLTPAQSRQQAAYLSHRDTLYTVSVRVAGHTEQVFVTPVKVFGENVNAVQVAVSTPEPTAAQREAMVRVALGMFDACWPARAQSLGDAFWRARLTQPWQSWQVAKVGVLNVGWRGKEDVPAAQRKQFVGALDLRWPADGGRCTF